MIRYASIKLCEYILSSHYFSSPQTYMFQAADILCHCQRMTEGPLCDPFKKALYHVAASMYMYCVTMTCT